MKYLHFKIEIYSWDIYYIEVENKEDLDQVIKKFSVVKPTKQLVKGVKKGIKEGYINAGEHYYNFDMKKSLILLYNTSSIKERMNIICHEKRHLEDRICQHLRIDDIEASAYLAGYIAEKLVPIL